MITVLEESLSYLRFNCIWPPKMQELNPSKLYYIKFILMLCSTSVIIIGCSAHLVVSLKNGSNNITEDIVMLLAEAGVYYFIAIFVTHQKGIAKIYTSFSDFENFEKPHQFDEKNARLVKLSKIYQNFINFAISNICLYPFVVWRSCLKKNDMRSFQEICGLLVTTWLPFNINYFPAKQILHLWQCYTVLFTMKGAAVISFAIFESMEHLVIRIQHMKLMLQKAVETDDCNLRSKLFSDCIKYHINIYEIGDKVDKHYTGCLFLHVLVSGVLFGCIGYRIMEEFSMNAVCIFAGWVLSLIIVCISGQHLLDEATSVADTAYNSPWYDRDANFQKNLIFIIIRSQKPLLIHAGPFSYVSHVILLSIFKTAYSYMTLLSATSV